jgi:EmrB/QacA subfamily drug resistance transporter
MPPLPAAVPAYNRIVPLIVAVALFMEQMDSTVIATSLPTIALDIGTNPLSLKLAITSYLLSLALFIPASGWIADRFGARTIFRAAIGVFVVGSIACSFGYSLTWFVCARILQGIGGAMMTPVGRLVLVRTIDRRALVDAMAWVTVPALIGPVLGPPIGGFITTYLTWNWIFLVNVPIGIVGIILVTLFIEDVRVERTDPFDASGFILSGLGVAGLAFGLSILGLEFLPLGYTLAIIACGALFTTAYILHAKRVKAPLLDLTLFELATFRASVIGGFVFRIGLGALPFLLPLLMQLGFHYTPLQSGLITFVSAVGAMAMKTVAANVLRRLGFRTVLVFNGVISIAFLAACATFTPHTPVWLMVMLLLVGGFFRSLEFTSINTIAYAEVPPDRVSRATSLVSVGQQLSISTGVAVGALAVELTSAFRRAPIIEAADFPSAFLIVSAISILAIPMFAGLSRDAGAELANRTPGPTESTDQRLG